MFTNAPNLLILWVPTSMFYIHLFLNDDYAVTITGVGNRPLPLQRLTPTAPPKYLTGYTHIFFYIGYGWTKTLTYCSFSIAIF